MTIMIWRIVLYTVGTLLAMRSLVSLLANPQRNLERKLRGNASSKGNQPTGVAGSKPGPKESVAA